MRPSPPHLVLAGVLVLGACGAEANRLAAPRYQQVGEPSVPVTTSIAAPATPTTQPPAPTTVGPPVASTLPDPQDIERLIYESDIPREQRTGVPRDVGAAAALIDEVRPLFNDVRVGDEIPLLPIGSASDQPDTTERDQAPLAPVARGTDTALYVIGWVDVEALREPFTAEGKKPIAFVYDDNGTAIGSVPLPDALPASFPLPDHLEFLRVVPVP